MTFILSRQFYSSIVPSISLVDEPITRGPYTEFCNLMKDLLVERQNLFLQETVATDHITMPGLPLNDEVLDSMYRLHRWCEHVRTPHVLSEKALPNMTILLILAMPFFSLYFPFLRMTLS
jgi:hypothetical protein